MLNTPTIHGRISGRSARKALDSSLDMQQRQNAALQACFRAISEQANLIQAQEKRLAILEQQRGLFVALTATWRGRLTWILRGA